ncbi:MAG: FtsL-like putative cell division protein [Bacteroidales bacterium]|nr:hypothetical protein [Lentimicrobiaceae bacterium]MDD5694181.1 FtsL-like putative cell division protein [Bacteroidales bacterium]
MNNNDSIHPQPDLNPSENNKRKKRHRISRTAHTILDGSFLTREKVIRLIPFVLYLMFLAIVQVALSYRAEKTWFEINALKNQMNELRYHYITSKSELMSVGRQSTVALRLKETGLRETTVPPIKLASPDRTLQVPTTHE